MQETSSAERGSSSCLPTVFGLMTKSLKEPMGVVFHLWLAWLAPSRLGMASGVGVGVGVGAGVAVAAGVGAGVAATVAGVGVGVGSSPPQAATRARRAIMTKAVASARHPGVRVGRRVSVHCGFSL